jgi:predicted GTPase
MAEKVIIMGAAGRDFHNFNVYFRDRTRYEVVAFTATQIPDIEGRLYPPELAGSLYPTGIPIHDESDLKILIKTHSVKSVFFSYSDVTHEYVMRRASLVTSLGANFTLLSTRDTMIQSSKPVISVCAVRTGCGKSQTSRKVAQILQDMGNNVVIIRHPMPYGDLNAQMVQRFASYADFDTHNCTIEEREEYEPIVDKGMVVFAGVDYELILSAAEAEADVIVWDGGNNDTPFIRPDIHIVVFDPFRAGHELKYYPGTTNMRMADIAIINKVNTAEEVEVNKIKRNIWAHVPGMEILLANSRIVAEDPEEIKGKRVLVVEDGPTLTHGGMAFGAGHIAAKRHGASEIVDPRGSAVGRIQEVYEKYPHIDKVLPAMGYGAQQIQDLEDTINSSECDLVLYATPIKLGRIISINKPFMRVRYKYGTYGVIELGDLIKERLESL